jgi:hypothetical protein
MVDNIYQCVHIATAGIVWRDNIAISQIYC